MKTKQAMNHRQNNYCVFQYSETQGCFDCQILPCQLKPANTFETLSEKIRHDIAMNFIIWFHIHYPVLKTPRTFTQVKSDFDIFLNCSDDYPIKGPKGR